MTTILITTTKLLLSFVFVNPSFPELLHAGLVPQKEHFGRTAASV